MSPAWRILLTILMLMPNAMLPPPTFAAPTAPTKWQQLENAGDSNHLAGEFFAASEKFKEAAEYAKNNYGTASPEYLQSTVRLASALVMNSQYDKAEPYYQQIMQLDLSVQKKGLASSEVIVWLDDLADAYYGHQNPTKREHSLKHCMALKAKIYGPMNYNLLGCISALGEFYWHKKDYLKAEQFYTHRFKILDIKNGATSQNRNQSLLILADVNLKLKHYKQAETLCWQVMNDLKKEKIPDVNIFFSQQTMGYIKLAENSYPETEKTFKMLMEQGAPGMEAPLIMGAVGMGDLYEKKADHKSAEKYYRTALDGIVKSFGPHDVNMIVPLTRLAGVLKATGKTSEAAKLEAQIQPIETHENESKQKLLMFPLG
jgi:hypothetical protein